MGHLEQRHTLLCTGLRGGLNRGLEKTPTVRAWRSLRDSTLFQPSDDEVYPLKFARQIDVRVNGLNRRCSSLCGNENP
jgi:hypothetical protein